MWQRRDTYQQHLYNNVLVKRTRVLVRNREIRMWSLVAKKNIPPGTFIGFYTGCTASRTCPPGSHYALQIGPSQPCIVPFPDESEITPAQREFHALANMNEPIEGEYANCHMAVQDFSASEIENVAAIQGHARFYRGMACFACERIDAGEALTWNYGTAFEPIRQLMNYTVGQPCRRVLENEVFIQPASQLYSRCYRHLDPASPTTACTPSSPHNTSSRPASSFAGATPRTVRGSSPIPSPPAAMLHRRRIVRGSARADSKPDMRLRVHAHLDHVQSRIC